MPPQFNDSNEWSSLHSIAISWFIIHQFNGFDFGRSEIMTSKLLHTSHFLICGTINPFHIYWIEFKILNHFDFTSGWSKYCCNTIGSSQYYFLSNNSTLTEIFFHMFNVKTKKNNNGMRLQTVYKLNFVFVFDSNCVLT